MFFVGCVNTGRLDTFSNFDIDKSKVSKIYLIVDCFVLDDVSGQNHAIDVEYNGNICTQLSLSTIREISRKTDIEIMPMTVTTGLQAGIGKYIGATEDEKGPINLPVYFSEAKLDPNYENIFSFVAEKLNVLIYGFEHREKYVKSLTKVNYPDMKRIVFKDNSLVMFVLMDGVRVPTDKSVGQGVATTLLTFGMVTAFEHSITSAKAILLNSDGYPVWGDAASKREAVETNNEVISLASSLFRYFPVSVDINDNKARNPTTTPPVR